MVRYFETVKSFADIPVDEHDGVNTMAFLEASDGLVAMFDLFGSSVFGFVQADIKSNINGVRGRYEANPDDSGTLEALVKHEARDPMITHKHGTACLVRLIRGLAFTCQALQNMQNDRLSELHSCFKRSYDTVLRHHHTFFIRSVVLVAIRAVPRRHDFYKRIAEGAPNEELDAKLEKWLEGLESVVKHMGGFLEGGGFGRV